MSSLNDLHNCSVQPQRTAEIRIFYALLPATQPMPCHNSCVLGAPQHQRYRSQWRSHADIRIHTQNTLEIYSDLFSGNIAVRLPIHSHVRVGKGSLCKLLVAACWCQAWSHCICAAILCFSCCCLKFASFNCLAFVHFFLLLLFFVPPHSLLRRLVFFLLKIWLLCLFLLLGVCCSCDVCDFFFRVLSISWMKWKQWEL